MGTKKSRAKWHNDAKDTDYDFEPRYDEDVRASLKNLKDTEKKQNHKWVIDAWTGDRKSFIWKHNSGKIAYERQMNAKYKIKFVPRDWVKSFAHFCVWSYIYLS